MTDAVESYVRYVLDCIKRNPENYKVWLTMTASDYLSIREHEVKKVLYKQEKLKWISRDGQVRTIQKMNTVHLLNTINFLKDNLLCTRVRSILEKEYNERKFRKTEPTKFVF